MKKGILLLFIVLIMLNCASIQKLNFSEKKISQDKFTIAFDDEGISAPDNGIAIYCHIKHSYDNIVFIKTISYPDNELLSEIKINQYLLPNTDYFFQCSKISRDLISKLDFYKTIQSIPVSLTIIYSESPNIKFQKFNSNLLPSKN